MRVFLLSLATLALVAGMSTAAGSTKPLTVIVCAEDAPPNVKLAAKEIRRYVYLRTNTLLPIAESSKDFAIVLKTDEGLEQQQYSLKTTGHTLTISGGSDVAVLYGVYAFAEKLGVRFYLHGDVVPDSKIALVIPQLDETHKPLFALRGVNPWGSHPFGFDAWDTDDCKAIFTQLAKMRMNFLGLHCYPDGHPYAEPTVWHGLRGDFDERGRVNVSYPANYYNTLLRNQWRMILTKKTSVYSFGGSLLFERDDWASEVMRSHCPAPETPEACNEVFNRMGAQFRDAFGWAKRLGVKTCIGTEAPLTIPKVLHQRLRAQGKNPDDPAMRREVYEGTFRRIMASHPLDYYWLWTTEDWTWKGNTPEEYKAVAADFKLAQEALRSVDAPFKLATCGWVLGPQHDRTAFDRDLPKDVPMSALNRATGKTPVEPAFRQIKNRELWAIPWLESDYYTGLADVQLVVGRMRRDAAEALAYGCTGLLGLHWRTEILAPNASALAMAAWDQSWNPGTGRVPEQDWVMDGKTASYPDARIKGTTEEALYRSCRYDMTKGILTVPNGRYKVTLKFCEPRLNSSGQRIFDVKLQGQTVIENLDIFARAGQFAALDFTFHDLAVTNGELTVEFVARVHMPCISAIVIEGAEFQRIFTFAEEENEDRFLPCEDFYADWSLANFGREVADDIAKLFTAIDGKVPASVLDDCPSGLLKPDPTPWSTIAGKFAFVSKLENLRPRVQGAGNLARFDYWLNTFMYHRALAEIRCAMGANMAPEEITRLWGNTYRFLLATVNSPGALGMVVNMEGHADWGLTVSKFAQTPFPTSYQGEPRIIVPCIRSVVAKGEVLTLKIIALDQQPVKSVSVRIRPLGSKTMWTTVPATHVIRAVYEAKLPTSTEDIEYHVMTESATGIELLWPATAPEINQTIVVAE